MNKGISPCPKCNCMTNSIRRGKHNYICGKCGADKTLSDTLYYEATNKKKEVFCDEIGNVRKGN